MGPPGSCRSQVGPMLAPWTLLSGLADNLEWAAPALQLGAPRVSMKGLEGEPQWPYGVRSRGIGGANVAGTRTSTMENFPNSINISYISWRNDYFHKIVEGMHHEYMHLLKKIFSHLHIIFWILKRQVSMKHLNRLKVILSLISYGNENHETTFAFKRFGLYDLSVSKTASLQPCCGSIGVNWCRLGVPLTQFSCWLRFGKHNIFLHRLFLDI